MRDWFGDFRWWTRNSIYADEGVTVGGVAIPTVVDALRAVYDRVEPGTSSLSGSRDTARPRAYLVRRYSIARTRSSTASTSAASAAVM